MKRTNDGNVDFQSEHSAAWVKEAVYAGDSTQRIAIVGADCHEMRTLHDVLRNEAYQHSFAHERGQALRLIVWELPDLVIMDTQLDGDDGIELCASLKRDARTRHIPIVLTAESCRIEEHLRAIEAGADDYLPRSATDLLAARARTLLQTQRWTHDCVPVERVVMAFERAIAAKDSGTGSHVRRLAALVVLIGRQLGLPETALEHLRFGARLHDAGKIGISEAILCKPGALTDDEYALIKDHPYIGAQILEPLQLHEAILASVRHHHERWDGQGYPSGLQGEAIPLAARIVAVADAFDAMITQRPYAQPVSIQEALSLLHSGAGQRWDPRVVAALVDALQACIPERELAIGDTAPAKETLEQPLQSWIQSSSIYVTHASVPQPA